MKDQRTERRGREFRRNRYAKFDVQQKSEPRVETENCELRTENCSYCRPYLPMISVWASVWPFIALSSSALVAPGFRLSFVSSA